MDIKKRQEAPADLKEQIIQTKLKRRAANISKYLWSKRNPTNPLKGYNLSLCKRRRKIKFKRCWECGSTTHLKANCPIHIKHQLMARVQELEALVQELSEKIHIQIKSRKRREFKRKKKLRKKKEKRRQRKIRAMNKAVKIKQYLLKEEETLNGIKLSIDGFRTRDHSYNIMLLPIDQLGLLLLEYIWARGIMPSIRQLQISYQYG